MIFARSRGGPHRADREIGAGRLADVVQDTLVGQLAVENVLYEGRQAIEDLGRGGLGPFSPRSVGASTLMRTIGS